MDNGHQRQSNAFDLNQIDRPKYFFDDRQNIQPDSIWLRQSNQRVRINEVESAQTESAVYRRLRETETPTNVYVGQHCSNCDRFKADKENRNRTRHSEWKNNRVSDNIDNRRWTVCVGCKNFKLDRYEIDVMMKNKSCGGDDALSVAMETELIGSSCNGNSTGGGGNNSTVDLITGGNNRLMTNENVLDHLKGMSLSDRRASVAPRITLTNVEDDDDGQQQAKKPYQEEEAMMTDDDQCTSPLSPRFLAVPKIEELGPERRPPQLVKIM